MDLSEKDLYIKTQKMKDAYPHQSGRVQTGTREKFLI
jgi:hypothetical protein